MFHARRFTHFPRILWIGVAGWSCLIGSFLATSLADAGEDVAMQPYTVFVAEAQSHARCGPSADYYRTDPLKHGQQLEVYAETKDGWLGVRPPKDSFCWIPADTVDLADDGDTGLVNEDRTVAWIGTHLGRARKYLWQVQLAEGESVTVIGRQERDGPDGPQLWLRIVPPSGEFRWVHRNQTVRTSEELVESLASQETTDSENEIAFQPAGPTYVDRGATRNATEATNPTNRPAKPNRRQVAADARAISQSGNSVMVGGFDASSDAPIGSGVVTPAASFAQDAIASLPPSLDNPGQLIAKPRAESVQRPKRRGLLASMAILGQPKIRDTQQADDIADNLAAGTTNHSLTASDDNWVSGAASRTANDPSVVAVTGAPMTLPAPMQTAGFSVAASPSIANSAAIPEAFVDTRHSSGQNLAQSPSDVMQVSGISPLPAQTLVPATRSITPLMPAAANPQLRRPTVVSAAQIAGVEQQVRGADVNTLRWVLSQLMSSQSSAAEVRVVADAARSLAVSSPDLTAAQSARTLATRADQYASLADRRDGQSVVQSATIQPSGSLSFADSSIGSPLQPVSQIPAAGELQNPLELGQSATIGPADSGHVSVTGQLVQVYSARTHSPPFALTDGTGRTIAYVTPSPGINLRMHLNQQVTVTGTQGFVSGLNMPHVMALRADR